MRKTSDKWRTLVVIVGGAALAAAVAPSCTNGPPDPANGACALFAGRISGNPSMELGTGAHTYIPRANGDRWLAGFGQQGGAHLWMSVKSQGLGPRVTAVYRTMELDGGLIDEGAPVQLCLYSAEGGGQQATGIVGFIENPFPEPCSRVLCGPPFKLGLTLTDSNGHAVTQERTVNGVDVGDTLNATTSPDCAGANYNPHPQCDGGMQ